MRRRPALTSFFLAAAATALAVGSGAQPGPGHEPVARPLPFFYDLYTFRGTADSTIVVASFAVPVGSLHRERIAGDVRYRFDVTLALADTADRSVFRTDDSVYVRLPRAPARRHLLSTHVQVQAPPSHTLSQYVILTDAATPGVGQLYTSPFPVPDYSGDQLMLSDVALSQPGAEHGWRHGGATLALLPTSEFPHSAFDVYYEIYNLPEGHRYTTEIAVSRVADADGRPVDDDSAVRVRYSEESDACPAGTLAELRYVDAAVSDGRYRIAVTITDQESGRAASRSREFQVSEWTPGATLVTALPRGSRTRGSTGQ